jgi:hypothetical protein
MHDLLLVVELRVHGLLVVQFSVHELIVVETLAIGVIVAVEQIRTNFTWVYETFS